MKWRYFLNIVSQCIISLFAAGILVYFAHFYGIFAGIVAGILGFLIFVITLLAFSLHSTRNK